MGQNNCARLQPRRSLAARSLSHGLEALPYRWRCGPPAIAPGKGQGPKIVLKVCALSMVMAQSFPMWTHCCCPQRGKAQERIFHVEKQQRIVWQIYDEARECIEVRRGRGGIRNRCSMKWKRIAAPTTPYRTSRPIAALRRPRTHSRRLEKISHPECCRRSLTQTYSGVKRRGGAACPWCSSSRRRRQVLVFLVSSSSSRR